METLISRWILPNWEKKLIAALAAIIIWLLVSQSITETRTIPGIPIKIINLPPEKTVEKLLPNGFLNKRISLTLTGTSKVIEHLTPSDLEVVLDATNAPEEWAVMISKKNLASVNNDIDLARHISAVSHQEFVIHLTPLISAKIPVTIDVLDGSAPAGYEFLDVWPRKLEHTIRGPEEQVQALKGKGLEVKFDLSKITQEQLDKIKPSPQAAYSDEISFPVPNDWKKVAIPFLNDSLEAINDPEAKFLQINFLKREYIPLEIMIPVRVFYPQKTLELINPKTAPLKPSQGVIFKEERAYLTLPTSAYPVSRLFLDLMKDYMEITVIAAPMNERESLEWGVDFVDAQMLEDRYVNALKSQQAQDSVLTAQNIDEIVGTWRQRFRNYMQNLTLYKNPKEPLYLRAVLTEKQGIEINVYE